MTLIGLYYVWRLDMRWSEVERSEEVVEEIVEKEEPALAARPERDCS